MAFILARKTISQAVWISFLHFPLHRDRVLLNFDLMGRNGLAGDLFHWTGWSIPSSMCRLCSFPSFFSMTTRAAIESVDRVLTQRFRICCITGEVKTFFRGQFPLSKKGIIGGAVLSIDGQYRRIPGNIPENRNHARSPSIPWRAAVNGRRQI